MIAPFLFGFIGVGLADWQGFPTEGARAQVRRQLPATFRRAVPLKPEWKQGALAGYRGTATDSESASEPVLRLARNLKLVRP
ncbi:hypothetical protein CU048_03630 [Beijerinckiaceae bacterium]|nr:hypothetical protein CU048_03630 [Beijerinckiaceae bacterium]